MLTCLYSAIFMASGELGGAVGNPAPRMYIHFLFFSLHVLSIRLSLNEAFQSHGLSISSFVLEVKE